MFRVVTLSAGTSPVRYVRGVTMTSDFASRIAIRSRACDFHGSWTTRRSRSIARAGSAFFSSKIRAISQLRAGRLDVSGEPGDQVLPGGDRAIDLALGEKAAAVAEERQRNARIQRVAGDERLSRRAGLRESAPAVVLVGDRELDIEDRALGVGELRPVGKPLDVTREGGRCLGQLVLLPEDAADLERGPGEQLGLPPPRRRRLGAVALAVEEGAEGVEGLLATADAPVDDGDLIGRVDGQLVAGLGGEEPAKGGDP